MNRNIVIQITKGIGLLFFFTGLLFRALHTYNYNNVIIPDLSPYISDVPWLSFIYILLSILLIGGLFLSFLPNAKNWDKFISTLNLGGLIFTILGTLALMNSNIELINELDPDYPPTLGFFFLFTFFSIVFYTSGTVLTSFESINLEKLLPFLFNSSKKVDVFEELSKLKKLYDEKILSEEEFKQQKERLLNNNK